MSSLWNFVGGASNALLDQRKKEMAAKLEADRIRLMEELKIREEQRQAERQRDRDLMESEEAERERRREDERYGRQEAFAREKFEASQRQAREQADISRGYLANARRQTSLAEEAARRAGDKLPSKTSVADYAKKQIQMLNLSEDEMQAAGMALAGASTFEEVDQIVNRWLQSERNQNPSPTSAIFMR